MSGRKFTQFIDPRKIPLPYKPETEEDRKQHDANIRAVHLAMIRGHKSPEERDAEAGELLIKISEAQRAMDENPSEFFARKAELIALCGEYFDSEGKIHPSDPIPSSRTQGHLVE